MTTGHDDEDLLEAEVIAEERRDRRSPLRLVVGVLVIAGLLALAWWQRERIGGWLADPLAGDHRRPLPAEPIDARPESAASIPARPQPSASKTPASAPSGAAVLERRLTRLEDSQAALARQVQDLARDLAALARHRPEPKSGPQPEWLLAVVLARMALKLDSGGDLLAERLALKALTPSLPPAVRDDAAALIAATGDLAADLPGRARILALFDEAIQTSRQTRTAAGDGRWWQRWLAALGRLVQVRRRDRPHEDGDARESLAIHALELARARFLAGDIDQAVDALRSLGDDLDPTTAELRARLVQRQALRQALDALLRSLEQAAASAPLAGERAPGAGAQSQETTEEPEGL